MSNDKRETLVAQIQAMGAEKFALVMTKLSPEQRDELAAIVRDAPQVAADIKSMLANKVREDIKGIPALTKTVIDYAKAFGGLFDHEDNNGDNNNE